MCVGGGGGGGGCKVRHVWFKIRTYEKLKQNQADHCPVFRYLIERISAWSFL